MSTTAKEVWGLLAERNGVSIVESATLWKEIEEAYTDSSRHYHNLEHVEYLLELADRFKTQINDFDTLLFSIFYHDLVYDAEKSDNETQSAEIAVKRLEDIDYDIEKIVKCDTLIMATKGHEEIEDKDGQFLLDFDLAILGDSQVRYEAYTKKVRDEYHMYPDFLYRMGRKRALKHFLKMDFIYQTPGIRNSLEKKARKNLERELRSLS